MLSVFNLLPVSCVPQLPGVCGCGGQAPAVPVCCERPARGGRCCWRWDCWLPAAQSRPARRHDKVHVQKVTIYKSRDHPIVTFISHFKLHQLNNVQTSTSSSTYIGGDICIHAFDRHTGTDLSRQRGQADTQADKQADKQADTQADKQTITHTITQTLTHKFPHWCKIPRHWLTGSSCPSCFLSWIPVKDQTVFLHCRPIPHHWPPIYFDYFLVSHEGIEFDKNGGCCVWVAGIGTQFPVHWATLDVSVRQPNGGWRLKPG